MEWMVEDRYWVVALRYHPIGRGNLDQVKDGK